MSEEMSLPDPDAPLPGTLNLGAFSISLNVADLQVSAEFYGKLGFVETGGDAEQGYLILKNGESTIGLFHGMFEGNILTFNPGLTNRMQMDPDLTDVRTIAAHLEEQGLELTERPATEEGAAHVSLVDPDGNPILIDQFF